MSAAIALVYALGWVPLFVYRVEAITEALVQYDRLERLAVRLAPLILSLHVTLACLLLNLTRLEWRPRVIAAFILWLGALAFWLWGRVLIGPARERRLPDDRPLGFRTDGAFGVVRHPLYASYVALSLVPVLAVGSRPLCLTFVAVVGIVAVRAVQEERRLHAQLGDAYAAYCRRVKRLVPFVW